jgi:hypothetical protein
MMGKKNTEMQNGAGVFNESWDRASLLVALPRTLEHRRLQESGELLQPGVGR